VNSPSASSPGLDSAPVPGGLTRWILAAATAASFLLVLQNFAWDILPDSRVSIPPENIRPFSTAKTFAYVFDYDGSEPDEWPSLRSRVRFLQDGYVYSRKLRERDEVVLVGGDRFTHEPGRIVFATTDNTDPLTNGRSYSLLAPVLYRPAIGDSAMLVFICCVAAWYHCLRLRGRPTPPATSRVSRWRWHLAGAALLFLAGLYCNTGSLAPYAITSSPMVVPATGYAFNQDYPHFRVLFDFVDGKGRPVWDHAILLRRILFPVLGWPLMKAFGFEVGGVLASLAINTAAFVAALVLARRRIGERGAVLMGWLLALYPGAAYWAGQPYPYAVIFPASLLLMFGLMRLAETRDARILAVVSLAMGVAYLGYDLAITFVPATLIVLCWRRRFMSALGSAALQLAPLAAWVFALSWVFHQPVQNNNSGIYLSVVEVFLHPVGFSWWWKQVISAPGHGGEIFFASNFIFIPALFLVVVAVNPLTSRIRFHLAEVALLASGLALFLVLNLAPSEIGGWQMRGTWISRIYQPIFPALVFFISRWWQDMPRLARPWLALVVISLAAASMGDALIVFGPILDDPGRVSEAAFYRFYNHTDAHFLYEDNLLSLGRRPLGFKWIPPAPVRQPSPEELRKQQRAQLDEARQALDHIRAAIAGNRGSLIQIQRAYRDVGRALVDVRSAIYSRQQEIRQSRGEITAAEAHRQAKAFDDFVWPELRKVLNDPSLDSKAPAPAPEPAPDDIVGVNAGIVEDSKVLAAQENAVFQANNALATAESDLARAEEELRRLNVPASAPTPR